MEGGERAAGEECDATGPLGCAGEKRRTGRGAGLGSWAELGWAVSGFLLFLDFPNPFLFLFRFFKLKSI